MHDAQSAGECALLVFAHGNSFPSGTYNVLLDALRSQGHTVCAPAQLAHNPHFPVTSNWPHLVREFIEFAEAACQDHTGPVYLVGHSMGGFLCLMGAALHPELAGRRVAGVVMLDSPVMGGWRARALALAKRTRALHRHSPGRISAKRRTAWPSEQAVWDSFASKPVFASWPPQVLRDYITHGTHDAHTPDGPRRVLSFDRAIETDLYNTLPHNLDTWLRRHPLRCPVAFVRGTASEEMRHAGLAMVRKLVGPTHPERLQVMEGGHLFPLEKPLETAQAIEQCLRSLRQEG